MLAVTQGVGRFGWVCAPPENGTPNIEPVPESRNLVLETRIRSREPENRNPKTDLKPEMQEPGHWRHLLRLERRTTELNPQNPKLRTRNPLPENRIANNAGGRVPLSSLAPAIGAADSGTEKTKAKTPYPEPRSRILKLGFCRGAGTGIVAGARGWGERQRNRKNGS